MFFDDCNSKKWSDGVIRELLSCKTGKSGKVAQPSFLGLTCPPADIPAGTISVVLTRSSSYPLYSKANPQGRNLEPLPENLLENYFSLEL